MYCRQLNLDIVKNIPCKYQQARKVYPFLTDIFNDDSILMTGWTPFNLFSPSSDSHNLCEELISKL